MLDKCTYYLRPSINAESRAFLGINSLAIWEKNRYHVNFNYSRKRKCGMMKSGRGMDWRGACLLKKKNWLLEINRNQGNGSSRISFLLLSEWYVLRKVEDCCRRLRYNSQLPKGSTTFIYIKNSVPYIFYHNILTGLVHETTLWNVFFSKSIQKKTMLVCKHPESILWKFKFLYLHHVILSSFSESTG